MKEKKLTDEEIIKAFECCVKNQCGGCCPAWTLETDIECQDYISELALDLIHRLQNENERLNDMKFTQEHCDLYKESEWLKAELKKELSEHEEFTKKAKAEIERLTEEFRVHKKAMVKQVVKDTAKEIYTQVLEWLPVGEDYSVFIHNIEQWLKEKYGVEVE